jgi:uncharacterized protein YrzB (UPF0473 family)
MPKTPTKKSKREEEEIKEVTFERVMKVKMTKRNHGRYEMLYFEGRAVNEDGTVGEEVIMKGALPEPSLDKNPENTYMMRVVDPSADMDDDNRMTAFFKLEHKVDNPVPETACSLTEAENADEWTTVLTFPSA